jgi:hypothetical protein
MTSAIITDANASVGFRGCESPEHSCMAGRGYLSGIGSHLQ